MWQTLSFFTRHKLFACKISEKILVGTPYPLAVVEKWRIDGEEGSYGEEKMKWKSRFERKIYDSYIFTVYMRHVIPRPFLHKAGLRSDIFTTDSSKNDGLPATINTYVSPQMISVWKRETGSRMANVKKIFCNGEAKKLNLPVDHIYEAMWKVYLSQKKVFKSTT